MATKQTLNLKKRACHMGGHISGRTEYHGEDPVGACDLALTDLMLDDDEIDTLLGPGTWNRLFKKTRNGGSDFAQPAEFVASSKMPIQCEQKFEGSKVTLYVGVDRKVELVKCTLAKIRYEPKEGGLVLTSMQVQCNAEPSQVAAIYTHMDTQISAAVRFGTLVEDKDENQEELPLKDKAGGKDGDEARETAH